MHTIKSLGDSIFLIHVRLNLYMLFYLVPEFEIQCMKYGGTIPLKIRAFM